MGFFRLPRNRCRNVPRVRVFVNVETSLMCVCVCVCVCVLIELHITARFGLCRPNQSINDNKATRICSPQYASACARA